MPKNPFPYSNTNKRYHTYSYFMAQKFGGRVAKIPLDAGFTCPNLDGLKGRGGCTYCLQGSGNGNSHLNLAEQFEAGIQLVGGKWKTPIFLPYFQAHTNTYAPLPVLRNCFETALGFEGAIGLAIATRGDCITDEVADLLEEISHRGWLEVELGLQSVHNSTGERINRGHSYADFLQGFDKIHSRGIPVCVHLINGLPGETAEMMLETARTIAALRPHSVKIHLLHVLRGTALAKQLEAGEFETLSRDDYVQIVCNQLELLPPEVVIQRLTGDGAKDLLIAPLWSLNKCDVLNQIDKELARRGSMQGRLS